MMQKKLVEYYLDLRSLAAARVGLGVILLIEVCLRFQDLNFFYSDQGVLPRAEQIKLFLMPWSYSLHLISGDPFVLKLLFILQAFFAVMLIFGYKTKLATFMNWLFLVSLHNRNWFVINGGDDVFRCLLFLFIFIPWGLRWSVDGMMRDRDDQEHRFHSWWVLTLFGQMAAIYYVSFLLKESPIWREHYTAVYYALKLNIFVTDFGRFINQYDWLTKFFTFFTIRLEQFAPFVLFLHPLLRSYSEPIRLILCLVMISFHLGLILCFNLGAFPFILIFAWVGILPTLFWQKLLVKKESSFTVFFDGQCSFCQKGVYLIREFLGLNFKIRPAQSDPVIVKKMEIMNSWVVRHDQSGELFYRYDAFIKLTGLRILRKFQKFGDGLYLWVSHNRKIVSKLTSWIKIEKYHRRPNFIGEVSALFVLVVISYWNLSVIFKEKPFWYNSFFAQSARYLQLYQKWNMFAPFPKMNNIWFEVKGYDSKGKVHSLLLPEKTSFEKLESEFLKKAKSKRWRKFFLSVSEKPRLAKQYAFSFCQKKRDLKKVELVLYSQTNLLNHQKARLQRTIHHQEFCH